MLQFIEQVYPLLTDAIATLRPKLKISLVYWLEQLQHHNTISCNQTARSIAGVTLNNGFMWNVDFSQKSNSQIRKNLCFKWVSVCIRILVQYYNSLRGIYGREETNVITICITTKLKKVNNYLLPLDKFFCDYFEGIIYFSNSIFVFLIWLNGVKLTWSSQYYVIKYNMGIFTEYLWFRALIYPLPSFVARKMLNLALNYFIGYNVSITIESENSIYYGIAIFFYSYHINFNLVL